MSYIKIEPQTNRWALFLILLLTFTSVHCIAQEKPIQGKITNLEDIEGIHVLNITSRFNSVTDAFGNFTITAKEGDSLLFSSVHYLPNKVKITANVFERGILVVTLKKLINELDEVFLGSKLTGDLERDIKNIKVKKKIDFDSLGIPGFKGEPEEKIVPAYTLYAPTALNIEALYNHVSGYYRKLRLQRKWEAENQTVATIIYTYEDDFFKTAYGIPEGRTYDFLLFCIETTTVQNDFKKQRFAAVLAIFEEQSKEYLKRLETASEKKE